MLLGFRERSGSLVSGVGVSLADFRPSRGDKSAQLRARNWEIKSNGQGINVDHSNLYGDQNQSGNH
jgi:hypothetical protein